MSDQSDKDFRNRVIDLLEDIVYSFFWMNCNAPKDKMIKKLNDLKALVKDDKASD